MPYIGQRTTWTPCAYRNVDDGEDPRSIREKRPVHGKIAYINEAHRYFLAEAIVFGYALRECFKF